MQMSKPIKDARQAIIDSSPTSAVYLGCDSIRSKKNGVWYAKYSTVVIIHKDGCHGGTIFHDSVEMRDYGNIRQRMLNEVAFAVQHATDIIDVIGERHFEIHLDINPDPKYKSNAALKEAMGWVRGQFGDVVKCKPDGFAATHAADHMVRH
jgi:predicted RNase H-related nuclease YkuK (DUF458 family)